MSDLDKKLELILGLHRRDTERKYGGRTVGKTLNDNEALARIKQAFISDGWKDSVFIAENRAFGDKDKMTGQEWYNRFEKELAKPVESDHLLCGRVICAEHATEAAKRAAGLE